MPADPPRKFLNSPDGLFLCSEMSSPGTVELAKQEPQAYLAHGLFVCDPRATIGFVIAKGGRGGGEVTESAWGLQRLCVYPPALYSKVHDSKAMAQHRPSCQVLARLCPEGAVVTCGTEHLVTRLASAVRAVLGSRTRARVAMGAQRRDSPTQPWGLRECRSGEPSRGRWQGK